MRQQVYIQQHFRRGNALPILIVAPHRSPEKGCGTPETGLLGMES